MPTQVQEVAKRLSDLEIRVVVTSPYLRCLQTTRLVLEELLPNVEKIEVDLSLGEVSLQATLPGQSIASLLARRALIASPSLIHVLQCSKAASPTY